MALIKCEECGHMVSDKATSCPNCGAPVNQQSQQGSEPEHDQNSNNHGFYEYEEEPNNKNNLIWAIVAVAILAILGIGYYFYHDYKVKEAEKEAIEQARQDSIAAAKLEAERLEKLRQDSIAQIEKIKDGMPVPSDFIKQNYTCITKLKFSVIVKNLEKKGFVLVDKKDVYEPGDDMIGPYNSRVYYYSLNYPQKVKEAPYCRVELHNYVNDDGSTDLQYCILEFSSSELAKKFYKVSRTEYRNDCPNYEDEAEDVWLHSSGKGITIS